MIVLDQKAIEESDAMVVPSAAADGVFFQHSQSGQRFARVVNLRFGPFYALHEARGLCCHAAEMLKKIENDPLGGEAPAQRICQTLPPMSRRARRQEALSNYILRSRSLIQQLGAA